MHKNVLKNIALNTLNNKSRVTNTLDNKYIHAFNQSNKIISITRK